MIFTKLVIFDLDDTLIATGEAVLKAREAVLREFLGLSTPISLGWAQNGWQRLTWYYPVEERADIFGVLCRSMGRPEPTPEEYDSMGKLYAQVMMANLKLSEGGEYVLDAIRSEGILIGLVTNGRRAFQMEKITLTALDRWIPIDLTIIDEPGSPNAKPRPTSLIKLCEVTGVSPSEMVSVGDRVTDVIAGNLAGCHTFLYYGSPLEVRLPGPSGIISIEMPEYSIRRLEDLPRYLTGRTRSS